ncbi:DUF2478 domain-containing protein [Phenylobacterium sp. LjRoot219]|uniref:DUF2478 domain-containing protein n=1 Tax=Phenylobacterium sp. LjRoot219 TaxID=3342283 RepID=UPI003ECE8A99
MTDPVKPIAVVQGAPSPQIQALFGRVAASLRPLARVVGVVEETPPGSDGQLRSLVDDRIYPLFQDLGPSSTACNLDSESLASACEAVRRDIAAGCGLVVLSKFGKLETERSGLAAAFAAAVEIQVPILTSVAPRYAPQWRAFAAPLFVVLPPEEAAIHAWWRQAAPRAN